MTEQRRIRPPRLEAEPEAGETTLATQDQLHYVRLMLNSFRGFQHLEAILQRIALEESQIVALGAHVERLTAERHTLEEELAGVQHAIDGARRQHGDERAAALADLGDIQQQILTVRAALHDLHEQQEYLWLLQGEIAQAESRQAQLETETAAHEAACETRRAAAITAAEAAEHRASDAADRLQAIVQRLQA